MCFKVFLAVSVWKITWIIIAFNNFEADYLRTRVNFFQSSKNFTRELITIIFASSWLSILYIVLVAAYRTADIGNQLDVSFSIFIFGVILPGCRHFGLLFFDFKTPRDL